MCARCVLQERQENVTFGISFAKKFSVIPVFPRYTGGGVKREREKRERASEKSAHKRQTSPLTAMLCVSLSSSSLFDQGHHTQRGVISRVCVCVRVYKRCARGSRRDVSDDVAVTRQIQLDGRSSPVYIRHFAE